MKTHLTIFVASLAFAAAGFAAESKPAPAALTPEAAGPDYQVQGEYEGEVEGGKVGIQIVALGAGKFAAVGYLGGLPGAGWDGESRIEAKGARQGDAISFVHEGDSFTIKDGKAVVRVQGGDPIEFKKVTRQSPTMGAKPPEGAIVLFDGSNLDAWNTGAKVDDRKLLAAGAVTKRSFADFTLHLEFIEPYMPVSTSQGRGNSGIYIQNRYEIQILDSFGLVPNNGDCGSIYRQVAPKLNMCLAPLVWQTYDIDFTAPKWDGDKKTANAKITVKLNGVAIHENQEIKTKTGAGKAESRQPGPIQLQNHGNPVFFRNVWIVERK